MDLVALAAKYHRTCFASYVGKSNLKSRAFKDEAGQESAYNKSFLEMAPELRTGLESGKAYDMSYLLKKHIGLLEKRGIYGSNYTNQKLELRMKSHFGETRRTVQRLFIQVRFQCKMSLNVLQYKATENRQLHKEIT